MVNYQCSIIRSRYSCRSYLDKPVEEEKLEYIKECIRLAPSAVNRQPWKFRIVRSQEGREKLQSCYSRPWFNEAPLYILASVLHEQEWVRADGKPHGDIDVAIAVEHLCLAATEQGLGSCWVCNFDAQHMSWTNNAHFMHCLPVRRGMIVTDDVIEARNITS